MSAMSEKARSAAKAKVSRLTTDPHQKVDASSWTPPEAQNGNAQTGMRVLSRRAFKRGGKVHGELTEARADRKPRKAGGALTADSLINRDVKSANEEREGTKHIGGLKRGGHLARGGRAHKDMGGLALPAWSAPVARAAGGRTGKMIGGGMCGAPAAGPTQMTPPRMMMRAKGGRVHGKDCTCAKCSGGRVGKAKGGGINDGTRPEGGRLARAKGGAAKKGMNVNIIIAPAGGAKPPMPMPPPGAGPVGMHQGAPPPMMPPGAGAPMGPPAGMPPPQMRKRGGRAYPIESGAGGGLGRLEKIRAYG